MAATITFKKLGRIEWAVLADGVQVATAWSSGGDMVSSRGLRSYTWSVNMLGGGWFTVKTRDDVAKRVGRRVAAAAEAAAKEDAALREANATVNDAEQEDTGMTTMSDLKSRIPSYVTTANLDEIKNWDTYFRTVDNRKEPRFKAAEECIFCGKWVNTDKAHFMVRMMTDGTLLPNWDVDPTDYGDYDEGAFVIGSECAKKVKGVAWKIQPK